MTSCGTVRLNVPTSIAVIVQKYLDTWSAPMYELACKSLQTMNMDELASSWIESVNTFINSKEGCTLNVNDACPTRAQVSTYMTCQGMESPYKNMIEDVLNFYFQVACKEGNKPDKKNLVALLESVRTFACAYKGGKACEQDTRNWILIGGLAIACICCLLLLIFMMMRRDY